jgi:hypothetical protein
MTTTHDYYEILQVSPKADEEIIQAAYQLIVEKWHYERTLNEPRAFIGLALLYEAYAVLSDPIQRKEYDDLRRQFANVEGDEPKSYLEGTTPQHYGPIIGNCTNPNEQDGLAVSCPQGEDRVNPPESSRLERIAMGGLFWCSILALALGKFIHWGIFWGNLTLLLLICTILPVAVAKNLVRVDRARKRLLLNWYYLAWFLVWLELGLFGISDDHPQTRPVRWLAFGGWLFWALLASLLLPRFEDMLDRRTELADLQSGP